MKRTLFIVIFHMFLSLAATSQERDTDGDGIADSTDSCPYVPGPAQYNGCPGMPVEVTPGPAPCIYFEKGRAHLGPTALRKLYLLAERCRKDKGLYVYLYGRTDNTGDQRVNLSLSARRAAQCRSYLLRHGVNPDQVMAKGIGTAEPLAENKTAAGRKKNRSVSFKLKKFHQ